MHKLGDDKPLALGESVSLDSVLRVLVGTKNEINEGCAVDCCQHGELFKNEKQLIFIFYNLKISNENDSKLE